jgi:MoaA/NifB/PqqE/SkfB family radical SAM enzyme
MEYHTEPTLVTYLHARGASMGIPISGTFELTTRCNFSCPMCYVHQQDTKENDELTAEQWLNLARQAKEQGMMFALLSGSEPFIRKDFFEIYNGMKAMGFMISINTNGSMLTGEIRERLLMDPPVRINISLYGGCAKTYHDMCGVSAFEQVTENIRALKSAGVNVFLNYSITPYNKEDMDVIHAISQELSVPVRASSYMYPPIRVGGGNGCNNRLSAEESAEAAFLWDTYRLNAEEMFSRANNILVNEREDCFVDTSNEISCRAGKTSLWLTWDGKMLPCGMMSAPIAKPLETGFSVAWEQIKSAVQQIRLPQACATCSKRKMCCVCAAVCAAETGAFDKVPDYVCRRTEAMCKLLQSHVAEEDK